MTALGLRLIRPTIRGTLPVRVGRSRFTAPSGSRIAHAQGSRLAYVVIPSGSVHALVEGGEVVTIPQPLAALILARYFPSDEAPNLPGKKIR